MRQRDCCVISRLQTAVLFLISATILFIFLRFVRRQATLPGNTIKMDIERILRQKSDLFTVTSDGRLEARTNGDFSQRIRQFNVALETLRKQILQRIDALRTKVDFETFKIINGLMDGFMTQLRDCPCVITVVLPWINETRGPRLKPWSSLTDFSNILYQVYHDWTADNTLCSWIETPGLIAKKYDVIFNRTCNRDINSTAKSRSLEPVFLNAKPLKPAGYWPNDGRAYPGHFYTDPPPFVTYTLVHMDAVVTAVGDVISNNCKVVLPTCRRRSNSRLPADIEDWPSYDEIFVIGQQLGTATFHRMVEVVPRVGLHLDFLRSNPNIRIAALEINGGRLAELLRVVGLDPSRLVTGNLRGKVVYQPRSTGCGFANVQETQVLHKIYLDYIRKNFRAQPRNRLLVVRRSGWRRLKEQKAIEQVAKRLARQWNLNFTVFRDDPTPSLNDTMQLFHSAVVVIAPVGAAESNLYFAQPGTYVIEGVCNLPHVDLCLHWLIHVLGFHWHGVTSRGGCEGVIDVSASEVEASLRAYLQLWTQENYTR